MVISCRNALILDISKQIQDGGYALLVGVNETNVRQYRRENNAPNAYSRVENIYHF